MVDHRRIVRNKAWLWWIMSLVFLLIYVNEWRSLGKEEMTVSSLPFIRDCSSLKWIFCYVLMIRRQRRVDWWSRKCILSRSSFWFRAQRREKVRSDVSLLLLLFCWWHWQLIPICDTDNRVLNVNVILRFHPRVFLLRRSLVQFQVKILLVNSFSDDCLN